MGSWRKDWFAVGCLAGGIASVLKTLVNFILCKSNMSKIHYVDIAGGMILGKRGGEKPRYPLEKFLGIVADILFGSLFGAVLAHLLAKTPKGLEKTKGTIFGTSLWGTTLAIGTLLQIDGLSKPTPKTMTTMLGSSTLFGMGTGFLINKFGRFDQAEPLQPTVVKVSNNG